MTEKEKFRKAVFIVTYRRKPGKIVYLLLKRKLHWTGWEFPKGGILEGEGLFQAVKRELFEETGQKTNKIKKFPMKGKYKYRRSFSDRPGFVGQTYTLFAVEVSGQHRVKFDNREHAGFTWQEFPRAFKMLKFGSQKKCLRIANEWLMKENVR